MTVNSENGLAERAAVDADLLRSRARDLARDTNEQGQALGEVLVCRVLNQVYGLELRHLRSVQRARVLSVIPGTPAHVVGAFNLRGQIVTVLDLALLLRLPGADQGAATFGSVVVANANGHDVGLAVDDVLSVEEVDMDHLATSVSARPSVRGIARAELVVLDLDALFSDPTLIVDSDNP